MADENVTPHLSLTVEEIGAEEAADNLERLAVSAERAETAETSFAIANAKVAASQKDISASASAASSGVKAFTSSIEQTERLTAKATGGLSAAAAAFSRVSNEARKQTIPQLENVSIGGARSPASAVARQPQALEPIQPSTHVKESLYVKELGVEESILRIKERTSALGSESLALENLNKAQISAARGLNSLARAGDPTLKTMQDIERDTIKVVKAFEQGLGGTREMAAAIAGIEKRYNDMTKNANDNQKVVALARHEWVNLGRQFTDVGTSLAGGMSPLMVLTQQGGQIVDVFASSGAGAGAALKAFGATVAGYVLNPVTLFAAGAGAAVLASMRWKEATDALTYSLNGLGRQSGMTVSQLSQVAESAGARTGISNASARGLAGQFAAAGVSGGSIGGAIDVTRGLSKGLGVELDAMGKEIASALSEPAKGAEELSKKYGLVTFAQREEIKQLAAVGDNAGASAKLIGALAEQIERMHAPTSVWTRLAEKLGATLSNAADGLGRALSPTIEDEIKRLEAIKSTIGSKPTNWFDRFLRGDTAGRADFVQKQLDDLTSKKNEAERQASEDAKRIAEDQASTRAKQIAQMREDSALAVRQIEAQTYAERESVAVEKARTETLRQTNDVVKANIAAEAERASMLAEATVKVQEYLRTTDRTIAGFGKTSFERGLMQMRQERDDLLRNVPAKTSRAVVPDDREPSHRQYQGTRAGTYAASERSGYTPEATRTFSGGLFVPDEFKTSPARQARRESPVEQSDLAATVSSRANDLEAAYIRNAQKSVLQASKDDLEAQTRLLNAQAEAFGKSTAEAAKLVKEQELLNQYAREHIPITDALRRDVAKTAEEWGQYAEKLEKVKEKNAELIESLDKVRSFSSNSLKSFFGDLMHGEKIGVAGKKVLDQAIDIGLSNTTQGLVDNLFGKNGTNGKGSLLGGIFGDIFSLFNGDKEQKTQSMNVQAANVVVHGAGNLMDDAKGLFGGIGDSAGGFLSGIGNFFSNLFSFADGGVMTNTGALPAHAYADGGVAKSPQLALFGEGRKPEAYVPLPDGKTVPLAFDSGKASVMLPGGRSIPASIKSGDPLQTAIRRAEPYRGTADMRVQSSPTVLKPDFKDIVVKSAEPRRSIADDNVQSSPTVLKPDFKDLVVRSEDRRPTPADVQIKNIETKHSAGIQVQPIIASLKSDPREAALKGIEPRRNPADIQIKQLEPRRGDDIRVLPFIAPSRSTQNEDVLRHVEPQPAPSDLRAQSIQAAKANPVTMALQNAMVPRVQDTTPNALTPSVRINEIEPIREAEAPPPAIRPAQTQIAPGAQSPRISIHNYAGVQVEARKNAAGEIEVMIDRKIAANNARLPGMLSDYDRRRA